MAIILLDMDGVVADYSTLWCGLYNHYHKNDKVKASDITSWDQFSGVPMRGVNNDGFFRAMKEMPGAIESAKFLEQDGHSIIFVTAAVSGHQGKVDWLAARGFGIEAIIFAHHKHLIRGDIFVDDKPENVEAWAGDNPEGLAVLFDAPYNRQDKWHHLIRAYDWDSLMGLIAGYVAITEGHQTDDNHNRFD